MALWKSKWKSKCCRSLVFFVIPPVMLGMVMPCFADPTRPATLHNNYFTLPFSKDLALIDRFTQKKQIIKTRSTKPDMRLYFGSSLSQDKVGSFIYQAVDNPKKFVENAAATTIFTGLEAIGISDSVKQSVQYFKEKTRYKFGKCGKVKLTNRVRAESCLTDSSSIELQSTYDLDAVTVSFKWSL